MNLTELNPTFGANLRKMKPAFLSAIVFATCISGCKSTSTVDAPTPQSTMRPQTIALLVTPKMLPNFDRPDDAIRQFFLRYSPLTSKAAKVIVIFSVGNSDHILGYGGVDHWDDQIDWARTTDFIPISARTLTYKQIDSIVRAFRIQAAELGFPLSIYEQIDSGNEFTATNTFKYVEHPECTANKWGMFDIRGRLLSDRRSYATAPDGISDGTLCGDFLVDQVADYIRDLGFDGILYDNQLGTRGRWHAGDGPGYSLEETDAIRSFLSRSRVALGDKGLMWFDSYNNTQVEKETFSFPFDAYQDFDYLIASGFCVMTEPTPYTDDLDSKLAIKGHAEILATLDYVDPWYSYNSKDDYPVCSSRLEGTAIQYRDRIDGIMLFANDETGALVPASFIDSFAARFFVDQ